MASPPRFAERRRAAATPDASPRPRTRALAAKPTPAPYVPPEELVLLGAALGAFGVKGEIRVKSFTAAPESIGAYGPLYGNDGKLALTPKRVRPIKDGIALTCAEVTDRDGAEALKGKRLHAPRAVLPAVEDDEFYHVDLLGCAVETLQGERLGEVAGVHDFGAGDVLEVKGPAGTIWLEFTKASVPIVDLAARRLLADPPIAEATDGD